MPSRSLARGLALAAVVVTAWFSSVGCSGSHSKVDSSRFNGRCSGPKFECPGGFHCAQFDIDDSDVDGLSCVSGTDPCTAVTCATNHNCIASGASPQVVSCIQP